MNGWGIATALFSAIAAAFLGMIASKLNSMDSHYMKMDERLTSHFEDKNLHYSSQARTDEQIKAIVAMVQKAHERIDKIESHA